MIPIKAWAGVTNDSLDVELWPTTGNNEYCRLYRTRVEARKHYQAVVRVLIVVADTVETYEE